MYQGMTTAPLDGGVKQTARHLERSGLVQNKAIAHTRRPRSILRRAWVWIWAELRKDGRIEQSIAQLKLGYPVPWGCLHHGPL